MYAYITESMARKSGFDIRQRQRLSSFTHLPGQFLSPFLWREDRRMSPLRYSKRPRCEAEHVFLPSAQFKKKWGHT